MIPPALTQRRNLDVDNDETLTWTVIGSKYDSRTKTLTMQSAQLASQASDNKIKKTFGTGRTNLDNLKAEVAIMKK